jgi:hypothetical protein
VAELDPADEHAHLALMRRHAADGDRHAALRQFNRLDRALRTELGVGPGPEATALRGRLLAAQQVFPRRSGPLLGRDLELSAAEQALLDALAGRGRTLIVAGPAGQGKSSLLEAITARAAELGMARGHGTSARVEGAWPYAPVIEALAMPVSWAGASSHQRRRHLAGPGQVRVLHRRFRRGQGRGRCGPAARPRGCPQLAGARPGHAAGVARAPVGSVVHPDGNRAVPDQGGSGDGQYLLYGPTPYAEVIELACDLRRRGWCAR